jgi:hypothetical protein
MRGGLLLAGESILVCARGPNNINLRGTFASVTVDELRNYNKSYRLRSQQVMRLDNVKL